MPLRNHMRSNWNINITPVEHTTQILCLYGTHLHIRTALPISWACMGRFFLHTNGSPYIASSRSSDFFYFSIFRLLVAIHTHTHTSVQQTNTIKTPSESGEKKSRKEWTTATRQTTVAGTRIRKPYEYETHMWRDEWTQRRRKKNLTRTKNNFFYNQSSFCFVMINTLFDASRFFFILR